VLALQQPLALQAVQQATDGGAGDACAFGQLVRGQRAAGALQQEQHDEEAFAEAMRCKPGGAVAVDGGGQGKQLEAQAKLRQVGMAAAGGLVDESGVFCFQHCDHRYS